ncbi:MAG: flagellar basal body P-ring protein FlgI, partial [Planctomycetes bacterium]|nr:flagellar basal body P-ring protein FlgI [Planctomycetota bacterium]
MIHEEHGNSSRENDFFRDRGPAPAARAGGPGAPRPARPASAHARRGACALLLAAAALAGTSCGSGLDSVREADAEQVFVRGVTIRFLETAELEAAVGDFAVFSAGEGKTLTGVGLVVGLAGTGDRGESFRAVREWAAAQPELRMPPDAKIEEGAAALAMIEARIDPSQGKAAGLAGASVRPLGNAESFEDGVLLWTDLLDPGTGEVWAAALGPVLTTTVDAGGAPVRTPKLGRILQIGVKGRIEPGGRRTLLFRPAWPELLEGAAEAIRRAFPSVEASVRPPDRLSLRLPDDPLEVPEDLEARTKALEFRARSAGLARILLDGRTPAIVVAGGRPSLARGTYLVGGGIRVVSYGPARPGASPGGGGEGEDLAM